MGRGRPSARGRSRTRVRIGCDSGIKNLRAGMLDNVIEIDEVYHVGTLQPALKRRGSLEGRGLSVSLDPEAWRSIARLGGLPTYALRRAGGAFVDVYRALSDEVLLTALTAWATGEGYLLRGPLAELHCSSDSGRMIRLFATPREAEDERQALGDPDAYVTVRAHRLMTEKMADRALARGLDHALVLDHALSFACEDFLAEIDGLWWNDRWDPIGLSAPRGVIHATRLAHWHVERFQEAP